MGIDDVGQARRRLSQGSKDSTNSLETVVARYGWEGKKGKSARSRVSFQRRGSGGNGWIPGSSELRSSNGFIIDIHY